MESHNFVIIWDLPSGRYKKRGDGRLPKIYMQLNSAGPRRKVPVGKVSSSGRDFLDCLPIEIARGAIRYEYNGDRERN